MTRPQGRMPISVYEGVYVLRCFKLNLKRISLPLESRPENLISVYTRQIRQRGVMGHLPAFFEISKNSNPLHRSKFNILANFRRKVFANFYNLLLPCANLILPEMKFYGIPSHKLLFHFLPLLSFLKNQRRLVLAY